MTSGKRISRVVCLVDVFMIVSPRLVDELILSRREQALKGCSGHCFLWVIVKELLWWRIIILRTLLTSIAFYGNR